MTLTQETAVTGVRKNKQGQVVAFNINRKTWGRGSRGGALLDVKTLKDLEGNETGKQINMCCLGVYGRACGIGTGRLNGKGMLSEVRKLPKQMKWTVHQFANSTSPKGHLFRDITSSLLSRKLAALNDETSTTDASKERDIKAHFAKQGIKVRFVGKG